MEFAVSVAKARLSGLVAAAERGERVVITRRGKPVAELVPCAAAGGGGIDFEKLENVRRRLGIENAPPEEIAAWKADFEDPAFSRKALGLDVSDRGS